jgi:hypothetical protein
MAMTALVAPFQLPSLDTYTDLRREVAQTLLSGQKELERVKVQIFWRTGRLIDSYLRKHPDEKVEVQVPSSGF